MKVNSVIFWISGDKRVPMLFKGRLREGDPQLSAARMEGRVGDVKACPEWMGPLHRYTGVFDPDHFEAQEGGPVDFGPIESDVEDVEDLHEGGGV